MSDTENSARDIIEQEISIPTSPPSIQIGRYDGIPELFANSTTADVSNFSDSSNSESDNVECPENEIAPPDLPVRPTRKRRIQNKLLDKDFENLCADLTMGMVREVNGEKISNSQLEMLLNFTCFNNDYINIQFTGKFNKTQNQIILNRIISCYYLEQIEQAQTLTIMTTGLGHDIADPFNYKVNIDGF